ncbi:CLUMA_CG015040, isoform A [Clunio marinus]|uniref:CLUMA_CG015040, isoform A n=1 Tax=Clunio marinus TaxID=568069 RepID=A0A1J1ITI8_9DIPT|nr:CLUMA_CG015040, isoform A [Clunio marinus]
MGYVRQSKHVSLTITAAPSFSFRQNHFGLFKEDEQKLMFHEVSDRRHNNKNFFFSHYY